MQFRKDINGLRSIAVIAVVLFHFSPQWLPGGFAGVDVFFVISGFLMTGLIFRGFEQGNFSISGFYIARANRIIPALSAVCVTLLFFGWFYLNPIEYMRLGKHVASSVIFGSNILYWAESGYFAAASRENWLLHSWSLSVEWQFYVLYPIILVIMRKALSITAIKMSIVIGTIAGFAFGASATSLWPDASYYLLPTRAWEMLIGGVAFLYPMQLSVKQKKLTEFVGIALIFVSYFFFSASTNWPGYYALVPVMGSFMVIQAARNDSFITCNAVSQKIGAWSYSIYLWHWPLVVAIFYFSLSPVYTYVGIALSVLLGFLSYRFVEKIKLNVTFKSRLAYLTSAPWRLSLVIALLGYSVFITSGALFREPEALQHNIKQALLAMDDWDYPTHTNLNVGKSAITFIKGTTDKNILMIGASHIEQTYPYVNSTNNEYNVYYLTEGGCFLTPSYVNPSWDCSNIQEYKNILSVIKFDKIVSSIFLMHDYLSDEADEREKQINLRIQEYDQFLRFAKQHSKEVFIILGEPIGEEFDPKLSVKHNFPAYISVEQARENYVVQEYVLTQLQNLEDVIVIDPIEYLCTNICKVKDSSGTYYYKDVSHFRPWYAKQVLQYLDVIFH